MKLEKNNQFSGINVPLVQIIMDGVGVASPGPGNAVAAAYTPHLDQLIATCPHTLVAAHGKAVGLPSDDDMGNSEVGHNALGAGRVFEQGAKLVNRAIETRSIFETPLFKKIIQVSQHSVVHFIGLLSDGNVHSHIDHLIAISQELVTNGATNVCYHILLDGRDVGEKSALQYIEILENFISSANSGGLNYRIASGGGRMVVTMDRYEADWRIVERGWNAHVHGKGRMFKSASEAVQTYYNEDHSATDQFLPEFVIGFDEKPVGTISDGDAVIFFNFRGDRAIEISKAFEQDNFPYFDRGKRPDVLFSGMMEYDGDTHIPSNYLVSPPAINRTLGEFLAFNNIRQFACAETQKYGHVTYFWNGNRSGKFNNNLEKYVEVPSDRVPFEQRPWMKSAEVSDEVIAAISSGEFDYIRVNFANGDMVGHTGVFDAALYAVESVDLAIGRILEAVNESGAVLIITADHGNADEMYMTKKGEILRGENGKPTPKTAHTLNKVIYLVYDPQERFVIDENVENPGLANNAATVMTILGFTPPSDYEKSLIKPVC
ncbi:2,3-bisphosphoglycerate-independent phosphoglycerate mutase [Myxococcota bacterium]|nr:2,3-bisphosphoglycerate-independent phosphoglycerate mutase [Myxococcota bacterium]MBU1381477.1 2,3-bisphosphoglycerate-independent phosphoglycerate mutase [Myxococcota bacterium]MBU1497689.1 2,3-bisphosphoglycerate-independent phosphoglycerate mutase [Myxococcota bacterium]